MAGDCLPVTLSAPRQRQVEEIFSREALLLPLFHEQVYRFARPEVEGLVLNFAAPEMGYESLRLKA